MKRAGVQLRGNGPWGVEGLNAFDIVVRCVQTLDTISVPHYVLVRPRDLSSELRDVYFLVRRNIGNASTTKGGVCGYHNLRVCVLVCLSVPGTWYSVCFAEHGPDFGGVCVLGGFTTIATSSIMCCAYAVYEVMYACICLYYVCVFCLFVCLFVSLQYRLWYEIFFESNRHAVDVPLGRNQARRPLTICS